MLLNPLHFFNMLFQKRVKDVVSNIPKGSVLSDMAGSPLAYRTVGMIMSNNRNPKVPCHRVIRSDGRAGGYNQGGSRQKILRLKKEGVFL